MSAATGASGGEGGARGQLERYVAAFPALVKLVWRLFKDDRVPVRTKLLLGITGAYVLSPVDVLPDFLPNMGRLDDLVLIAFALNEVMERVPDEVLRAHWEGDEDVLETIRKVTQASAELVPAPLKRRLRSF